MGQIPVHTTAVVHRPGRRILGVNVYGEEGFYIPYFYALSDQIGANISGLIFFRKKKVRGWLLLNNISNIP
jgi:hypothetical protein